MLVVVRVVVSAKAVACWLELLHSGTEGSGDAVMLFNF